MSTVSSLVCRRARSLPSAVGVIAAALLLFAPLSPNVRAQPSAGYVFTPMTPPPACAPFKGFGPSLNNLGVVAYSSQECFRSFLSDGFTQQRLVEWTSSESINDSNQVGGWTVAGGLRVVRATPTASTTIAEGQRDGFIGVNRQSINEPGEVAFDAAINGSANAILAGNGGPLRTIVDSRVATPFGVLNGAAPMINNNGLVAFISSSPSAGVFVGNGGPLTRITGLAPISEPSLNDHGVVAVVVQDQTGQHVLVTGDGGPLTPVATARVGDPSTFRRIIQPSINQDGQIAFLAELNSNPVRRGIFTGPDPVSDRVVVEGDLLPGNVVAQDIRFSAEGLNDVGQIAFLLGTGFNFGTIYRADPPGSTFSNPILPPLPAPGAGWGFVVGGGSSGGGGGSRGIGAGRANWNTFFDPEIAIGYRYEVSGSGASSIASVLVPNPLPHGDATFEVRFAGHSAPLIAGTQFDFTAVVPGGVREFTIAGIDQSEVLDPNDVTAFVTGLRFVAAFEGVMTMTPLTDTESPVLTTPGPVNATASAPSGVAVVYAVTAVDDQDADPSVACAPESGSVFPVGTTTVACTATDDAGNQSSASFSVTVTLVSQRRTLGSGYNLPETPVYRATFAVDVTGPAAPSGSLTYSYSRTRMNFVSTGISTVGGTGAAQTIEGVGTLNGVAGFRFAATATDGSPDSFGIVIRKPDGSLHYSAGLAPLAAGALTIVPK